MSLLWPVSRRIEAERRFFSRDVLDWDQVDSSGARAVDRKRIDLAPVVPLPRLPIGVMRVGAGRSEDDHAVVQATCLALHAEEPSAVVDDEVVPRVLAERGGNLVSEAPECQHHGECRAVSDVLRMIHSSTVHR